MIQNGGLCPLKLLPLIAVLSVFMSLQAITPGNSWLGSIPGKGYKIIWNKKIEGNDNKIILGDFNFAMDKINKEGRNETQRLYRCDSKNALSKLIVDNVFEGLWTRKNPYSSEFTRYDRSSGTRSRIYRVYIDIKIANNTKIYHITVSFADYYNAISFDRLSSKTKIEKD